MKKLTNRLEFEKAKKWLQNFIPKSLHAYQWLQGNTDRSNGLGTSTTPLCFVDQELPSNIIACVDLFDSYGYDNYPKFYFFTIYQDNAFDSKLVKEFLLKLSDQINITAIGGFEAKGIDAQWLPVFDKVFADKLSLNASIGAWPCGSYWIPFDEQNRLRHKSIEAPVGFEFRKLESSDAEIIDANWSHRVEGSNVLPTIKKQINDFPNICLKDTTTTENRLACFELTEAESGYMSHLYTMPEFRRRGLATLVETKLAQLLVEKNLIPVKAVLKGNVSGEKITETCSMWKFFGDTIWLRYGNEKIAPLYVSADASSRL